MRIWQNEDAIQEQGLNAAERTAYHHAHSLPTMANLRQWGQEKLASGAVEANSGLGKAIGYFERHYDRLIAFCKYETARLDNNVMERHLKLIVRNLKTPTILKQPWALRLGMSSPRSLPPRPMQVSMSWNTSTPFSATKPQ